MRILAIITGEYGQRHVDNIRSRGPSDWQIEVWQAPSILPPVIDYPEDYLPDSLPPADLVLHVAWLEPLEMQHTDAGVRPEPLRP